MPDIYAEVKEHFESVSDVIVNRGQGAQGLKAGTKMFGMFTQRGLLLTMPKDRVQELIAQGVGKSHTLTNGTTTDNRILIGPHQKDTWIEYATEARASFGKK